MPTAVEQLTDLLQAARVRLGAASCTFYVVDPYWQTEYRLVCMPGVKLPEPMYGFITPDPSTRYRICEGPDESFTESDSEREGASATGLPLGIPLANRSLFLDFAEREGVQSHARLKNAGLDGSTESIFFINFDETHVFDGVIQEQIRTVNRMARLLVPEVKAELLQADARPLAEAVRILQPVQAFTRRWVPPFHPNELASHFAQILERSIQALDIDPPEAFGTVHLYEPGAGLLRLKASFGNIPDIEKAKEQDVFRGVGVISWVVLRQRSLLINDIRASDFSRIQVVIDEAAMSELAVPMIANGELVGVLNLECRRKNAFSPASVRSIWYAAESAALVYQSWRNARTTWALMDITAGAIKGGRETQTSMNKLAVVLQDSLGADLCDLWHLSVERGRLEPIGASYGPFEPGIRERGWSWYAMKTKEVIWIDSIQDPKGFSAMRWKAGKWEAIYAQDAPRSVNDKSLAAGVQAEMGVPILLAGSCVAVAWLKYKRSRLPPEPERLDEAFFWANQAGIVVESIQHQLEKPERSQLRRVAQSLEAYWHTGPLDFGSHVPIEGFAYHYPLHVPACGDFHAVSIISESTVGLLVGDGEGHAVSGLLNALPLIATFNSFGHEAGSSRYLMDKLMAISIKLGLRGTAVYCTFTVVQDPKPHVYLSATSAGHPPLILLRREEHYNCRLFPQSEFALGRGLGFAIQASEIKLPLGEDQILLKPGDILVAFTDGISEAFEDVEEDANNGPETCASPSLGVILQAARTSAVMNGSCADIANAIAVVAQSAARSKGSLSDPTPAFADDATVCVVRVK